MWYETLWLNSHLQRLGSSTESTQVNCKFLIPPFYTKTDRFFFRRLVEFMCCHPLECLILAHPDAIQHWRALMGPTKPYIACNTAPRTIRGRFGLTDTRNSTHGSGESACRLVYNLWRRWGARLGLGKAQCFMWLCCCYKLFIKNQLATAI